MKNKIGLGILYSSGIDSVEQLKVFRKTGFDAFFSCYERGETEKLKKTADELGLIYQSIHAPFTKMYHMWYQSDVTEKAKQELIDCVAECAKYNVPLTVIHPFISFELNEATEPGIANFKEVVDYAKEAGVKVAFENVEGEAYLEALMTAFKNYDNVGFCWDTGHEMCYNRFKDMLAQYGDRLIATHIDDNMGVSGEEITFLDDLHLVPFDGVMDWEDAMARLDKCGYDDIMTFELKMTKEIDEKFGTGYTDMKFEDYVKKVYDSAEKLCAMRG